MVAEASEGTLYGVPRIVDGDTMRILGENIRLEGIDTPETGQRCRDANGRCYRCGWAATDALRTAIGPCPIRCEVSERDRYGRLLATCLDAYGRNLNALLVRRGYALAYIAYSDRYASEEEDARDEGLGLHAGEFVDPWDWRRGERMWRECPR